MYVFENDDVPLAWCKRLLVSCNVDAQRAPFSTLQKGHQEDITKAAGGNSTGEIGMKRAPLTFSLILSSAFKSPLTH